MMKEQVLLLPPRWLHLQTRVLYMTTTHVLFCMQIAQAQHSSDLLIGVLQQFLEIEKAKFKAAIQFNIQNFKPNSGSPRGLLEDF